MSYAEDLETEIQLEEAKIEKAEMEEIIIPKDVTGNQKRLIKMFADKSELDYDMVLDWVENGEVTMAELSSGIL